MLADLRMDAISEIDHGRAERKIEEVALRRKNEDLFGEEVVLDGREKFLRVLQILLPLDQPPQPREALGIARLRRPRALLITPMRRDSEFRDLMHLARANLHLHPLPTRSDHCRMQRLIH